MGTVVTVIVYQIKGWKPWKEQSHRKDKAFGRREKSENDIKESKLWGNERENLRFSQIIIRQ